MLVAWAIAEPLLFLTDNAALAGSQESNGRSLLLFSVKCLSAG